jgi:hypothetical protein
VTSRTRGFDEVPYHRDMTQLPPPPGAGAPLPPPLGASAPDRASPGHRGRRVIVFVLVVALAAGAAASTISRSHAAHGDFTFLNTAPDGSPYRWNPCEPIHYAVNLTGAPPYALTDVREATHRVSEATGIPFVYDGATPVGVDYAEGRGFQSALPGQRWMPVLIIWLPEDQFRYYASQPGVLAFSHPQTGDGTLIYQYVSGELVVNAGAGLTGGFAERYSDGLVLMHELGHMVGLGHVSDPNEVMFRARDVPPNPLDDWGPGDLVGLERVGRDAGCLTDIRNDG